MGRLAAANIFLVVFNLIPAFPMDGGRVLHALLAMRVGGALATEIAARIGQAFALGLGFLGLFGNPLLLFIAIFIYMAAAGEAQMSAAHEALKGLTVAEAMETRFTPISIDASLSQAVDALLATAQHEFPVVDAFSKPAGLLTREDILAAVRSHGGEEPASAFMRAGVDSVRPAAPVESVFEAAAGPESGGALRHRRRRRDRRPADPAGARRSGADPLGAARLALRPAGVKRAARRVIRAARHFSKFGFQLIATAASHDARSDLRRSAAAPARPSEAQAHHRPGAGLRNGRGDRAGLDRDRQEVRSRRRAAEKAAARRLRRRRCSCSVRRSEEWV